MCEPSANTGRTPPRSLIPGDVTLDILSALPWKHIEDEGPDLGFTYARLHIRPAHKYHAHALVQEHTNSKQRKNDTDSQFFQSVQPATNNAKSHAYAAG